MWFGSVSLESGFYHRDLYNRSGNKTNWETLIFSRKYSGLDILLDSGTCSMRGNEGAWQPGWRRVRCVMGNQRLLLQLLLRCVEVFRWCLAFCIKHPSYSTSGCWNGSCITIWNFPFLSHLRPFWKFLPGGLFFQCCSLHVVHITSSCRQCTPRFPVWKLDHFSLTDWNWKHKYYHHILTLVSCDGSSETQTQTKKIKSNQIDSAATLCITSHTLYWHSAFLP